MSELQYDNRRGTLSRKEGQTSLRIEEGFKSQVGISRKTTQRKKFKSLEEVNTLLLPVGWHVYKVKGKPRKARCKRALNIRVSLLISFLKANERMENFAQVI